jgi:hypothetical protein
MSKIALSGNSLGSGTLTISAPNTNVDRVLDLPDSAGTIATAESTLAQFNASGSAPVYACRAWVNFDGTTTPPTIRASGNVSSVTRNGTGDYTVNLTTAMPDANFSIAVTSRILALDLSDSTARTTTSFRIVTADLSGNSTNYSFVNVAIFR